MRKSVACLFLILVSFMGFAEQRKAHPYVGLGAGYPGAVSASFGVYTPKIGLWYLDASFHKDLFSPAKDLQSEELRLDSGYLFRIWASPRRNVNFYLGGGLYAGKTIGEVASVENPSVFNLRDGYFWGIRPDARAEFFVAPHCALNLSCTYERSRVEASLGIVFVF